MSIANNPNLSLKKWSDEIELRGGEIHDFYADAIIFYTEDNGQLCINDWKIFVREKIRINGEEVEVKLDFTNRVKEETIEKIVDEI